MEEKLYFKPEPSGNKKEKSKSKKENHRFLKLFLFLFVLTIIILFLTWLLKGSKTVSGKYPENIKNESLTCVSKSITPPKIAYIDSKDKELKINAIFNGADSLKSLSLIYTLYYESDDAAYGAEAKGHAEFNKSLVASNYSVDKFSNKFARYDNKLIITLNANKSELDEISAAYFLLSLNGDRKVSLESIADYKKNYELAGFVCESTYE